MESDQPIIKQFKIYHVLKLIMFIYNINMDKEIRKYYQYFWKDKHSILFMLVKLSYVFVLSSFHELGKMLSKRYIIIFCIYYQNKIIGLAHIEFNEMQRYYDGLLGIVLNRDVFGIGLGRKLMQTCINYCSQNNKRKIELDVFADNVRAISLYKKSGFAITYTKNIERQEYHMELKL